MGGAETLQRKKIDELINRGISKLLEEYQTNQTVAESKNLQMSKRKIAQ